MALWTFATAIAGQAAVMSGQRFVNVDQAATEAASWLATCAENGLWGPRCTVELHAIEDAQSEPE